MMTYQQQMEPTKRPLEEDTGYQEEEWPNKRLRTEFQVWLLLRNREAGQIIGKGGENINTIRRDSGAAVNIQKNIPGSFERVADVSGNVEQVSQAVQMIATSSDNPSVVLLAEARNLGPVIGKGGATINQIRNDTQANIHIASECIGVSSQKEIRITGEYGAVLQAIKSVIGYLAEGRSPVRMPYVPNGGGGNYGAPMQGFGGPGPRYNPNGDARQRQGNAGGYQADPSVLQTEMVIMVPNNVIGKIIGRGGSSINQIRSQSGATINVAPKEDGVQQDRKVTITGARQARNIACTMIETMATKFNNGPFNQQSQAFGYVN